MPYAARLCDSATVNRPVYGQSDTGRRSIASWAVQANNQPCHLQVNDVEAILQEFGLEGKAEAVAYFLRGVNLRPRAGNADALGMDRVTITQKDGAVTTWIVVGVLERKDKRGGYTVAALSHAPQAA